MKRLIAFLIVGLLFASLRTPTAQAHVLESDGGVSAVLHMPPDDAPDAGKNTAVNLAFASDDPDFDISDYRIQITLQRNDTILQTTTMQPDDGSTRDGAAVVTFPEPGAYRLQAQGTPLQAGKRFTLSYSVRAVSSDGRALSDITQAGTDFWIISLGSLVLLVLIARYNIRRGGRYAKQKSRK
jgi:hypothetical protein